MEQDNRIIFMAVMITAFFCAMLAEFLAGRIQRSNRPRQDLLFNVAAFFTQPILTGLVVASIGGFAMRTLFPGNANALEDMSVLLAFAIIFPLNEFCHYWVHRFAHEWRWLWKLHRFIGISSIALLRLQLDVGNELREAQTVLICNVFLL